MYAADRNAGATRQIAAFHGPATNPANLFAPALHNPATNPANPFTPA